LAPCRERARTVRFVAPASKFIRRQFRCDAGRKNQQDAALRAFSIVLTSECRQAWREAIERHPMNALRVYRLSENAVGESSFDDFELPRALNNFAPPAVPFYTSAIEKASGYTAIRIPVGWVGELHRSPHRQMLFCSTGALKVTATDGSVRTVRAGDAWLMADNIGKGHRSEVVSDVPFDAVIILLEPQDQL